MVRSKKKLFVIDTNVILHDSSCIYQFEEHDIAIPIPVLEELDHFKKGNDILNFHAREFVRTVDGFHDPKLFTSGVSIGPELGKITVELERTPHPDLPQSFSYEIPDNHILNIAYHLHKDVTNRQVIIVTKDVNLRVKARSVGLIAEDYLTDQVKDITSIYTGKRLIENAPLSVIEQLRNEPYWINDDDLGVEPKLLPNEFLIIRNERKSVLGRYDAGLRQIIRLDKISAYGITPRNAEQTFALSALLNDAIKLVTVSGKAGTGKTLLSLAAALEKRDNYIQTYMARPVIPLSNRDIGFLPGDVKAKLSHYMQPLYDNLGVIQNQFRETDECYTCIGKLVETEKLKIEPLTYIRGRSLVKIFLIVDEAQNLTPHEIKTIITRAGEGTKVIFTGDIFQIDHPYLDSLSNGMSYLIERLKGQDLYAHITLEKGERSRLAELASNLL